MLRFIGFVVLLTSCKPSASCPPREEVTPVVSAWDQPQQSTDEIAATLQQAPIEIISRATIQLADRLKGISADNGVLTGSDMKRAFVEAAKTQGIGKDEATSKYEAHAALFNAYILQDIKAGRRDADKAVVERSRTCAKQ